MKKIVVLFLVLILTFLCSCGSAENETTTAEPTTTESPTVKVTFPEGYTAVQIAKRLEENSVCSAKSFLALVNSPSGFSQSYDFIAEIEGKTDHAFALEGYIFPDTYEFYRGEKPQSVLKRFLNNTKLKLTDEFKKRAKEINMTMDEVITLASIIQLEADKKTEMANVSSVLHNRIKSPDFGYLQCDVTINYVNDYITGSEYLTGDTAKYAPLYNTYKCKGLPAGAICNPGIEAIEAALYPADTNYFYFVTDKDKNYYYAETYEKHLENCKICGIG